MKYLKIKLFLEKGHCLVKYYKWQHLTCFGLFIGTVVKNIEICQTSTKIYYLTLLLSFCYWFLGFIIYVWCVQYFSMKGHFFLISLLPIPENLGLEKLCHHDSLWHLKLFCSDLELMLRAYTRLTIIRRVVNKNYLLLAKMTPL